MKKNTLIIVALLIFLLSSTKEAKADVELNVQIQLDFSPDDIIWFLTDSINSTSILSSDDYTGMNGRLIDVTFTVPPGIYKFNIVDFGQNGLAMNGYYQLSIDNEIVVGPVSGSFYLNSHRIVSPGDFSSGIPNVIYVNKDATGINDGSTWTNAFLDVQDAIDKAAGNDSIWVAEGTYLPTKDVNGYVSPSDNRKKTFYIGKDNVRLFGGFNGTETAFEQRDVKKNITVLSGDLGVKNDSLDNAYNIVIIQALSNTGSITNNTELNGFVIKDGTADGPWEWDGGAMFIVSRSSSVESSPVISDCVFENNYASYSGGAVFCDAGFGVSSPSFKNCTFSNNNSDRNGGAFSGDSFLGTLSVDFINCLFHDNVSRYDGGAMHVDGSSGEGSSTMTNCTFVNNISSSRDGNHVGANGGTSGSCQLDFYNCILWGDALSIVNSGLAVSNLYYSLIQDDNVDSVLNLQSGIVDGGNNIDSDPLFLNTSTSDFTLSPLSPAINFGNNSYNTELFDLSNNVRLHNQTIDVGAYEFIGLNPCSDASSLETQVGYHKGAYSFTDGDWEYYCNRSGKL